MEQCIQVLLEAGIEGGRTGVRTTAQAEACLASLERWRQAVSLCGIEIYEGVVKDEAVIRGLLRKAVGETNRLAALNAFRRSPILLSGAGSSWYDVVAETLSSAGFWRPVEIVLRPGCYITHDAGDYRDAQARILASSRIARGMKPGLLPALHLWAYVQSIPEPGLAVVAFGRRDTSCDAGFPAPVLQYRPGWPSPESVPEHWRIHRMMDQHAFLAITKGDNLRCGDMLTFNISHPCLTFDKWHVLPVLDDQYHVVNIVTTFF